MLQFRHKSLIIFSGLIWFTIGVFLLSLGLGFIVKSSTTSELPLISIFSGLVGGLQEAAVCLVVIALLIGYYKGRYVLAKSVNRVVNRIKEFPEPLHITKMYSFPYYILISSMILLGMGIKYLGVPLDIRGVVDVAIGSALINGSMLYFRKVL